MYYTYDINKLDNFFGGKMFESILGENKLGKPVDFVDEDNKNYYMTIQAAGFKKEDLTITVEGRCVKIKGKGSHEKMSNSIDYYFTAPKVIKQSNIDAHLEHGILTVTIPKDEPESIRIEIK